MLVIRLSCFCRIKFARRFISFRALSVVYFMLSSLTYLFFLCIYMLMHKKSHFTQCLIVNKKKNSQKSYFQNESNIQIPLINNGLWIFYSLILCKIKIY